MPKKIDKKCCKRYRHKGKACGSCPLMARLSKSERKHLLSFHKKRRKKFKKKSRKKSKKKN